MIVRLFVFPTPCDFYMEKLNIFHSQASEKSGHFTGVFDARPLGGGGVKRWEARVLCARLETNDVLVSFDLLLHPRLVFRPEYVMIRLRDVRIRDLWLKRRESSKSVTSLNCQHGITIASAELGLTLQSFGKFLSKVAYPNQFQRS